MALCLGKSTAADPPPVSQPGEYGVFLENTVDAAPFCLALEFYFQFIALFIIYFSYGRMNTFIVIAMPARLLFLLFFFNVLVNEN